MDPLVKVRRAAAAATKARERYESSYEVFAKSLIEARDAGLTLRAIADAAGVSHVRVAKIVDDRPVRTATLTLEQQLQLAKTPRKKSPAR